VWISYGVNTSASCGLAFGAVVEKKESPRVKVGFALNNAVFRDANAVLAPIAANAPTTTPPCSAAMIEARREPETSNKAIAGALCPRLPDIHCQLTRF
jgi:hypothetical protein